MDYGTEIGLGRGLQDASQTLMQLLLHRDEMRRQQALMDAQARERQNARNLQLAELGAQPADVLQQSADQNAQAATIMSGMSAIPGYSAFSGAGDALTEMARRAKEDKNRGIAFKIGRAHV